MTCSRRAFRSCSPSAWWEVDPRALATLRTGVGLAALTKATILSGTAPLLVAAEPPLPALGEFSLRGVVPANSVHVFLLGLAVFGLALILGPQARASAALVAISSSGLLLLDGRLWSNHLLLLALLAAATAAAGGGSWRERAGREDAGRAARRCVRAPASLLACTQVATVYLFAGLSKLSSDFLDGSVLGAEIAAGPSADLLDLATPALVALSIATIAVEVALAVLLWLPRTRAAAAILGLVLHVSIIATVSPWPDLVVFALLTLSTYPLFLTRAPLFGTGDLTWRLHGGARPVRAV
jgi:hypothetical protein